MHSKVAPELAPPASSGDAVAPVSGWMRTKARCESNTLLLFPFALCGIAPLRFLSPRLGAFLSHAYTELGLLVFTLAYSGFIVYELVQSSALSTSAGEDAPRRWPVARPFPACVDRPRSPRFPLRQNSSRTTWIWA